MKKAIVIILIALVAVTSAFAFKFKSIGIDTFNGFYISANMEVVDNLDVYGRIGYIGLFSFSLGANYNVAELKINNTKLDVKPGGQFNFGFADHYFMFTALGNCEFAFHTDHFEAFLRPGCGLGVYTTSYKSGDSRVSNTNTAFAWQIETGVRYLF